MKTLLWLGRCHFTSFARFILIMMLVPVATVATAVAPSPTQLPPPAGQLFPLTSVRLLNGQARTHLTMRLNTPSTFTLYLRDPAWVTAGTFAVRINGSLAAIKPTPSSYAAIRREWRNGDRVDIELPMHDSVEGLPDGSHWYALLHGPILLASPDGTDNLEGLRAGGGRGDYIAHGPLVPLNKTPVLLASATDVSKHIVPNPGAGSLHFRIKDIADPPSLSGTPLMLA